MKKVLSLLAIILVLTSCSKDDSPAASIIGKWNFVKVELYQNNELIVTEIDQEDNTTCPDYTEIKADGTIEDVEINANCAITSTDISNYTYVSSILTNTETDEKVTVVNLTNNDMTLAFSFTEDGVTLNGKSYYKKIN